MCNAKWTSIISSLAVFLSLFSLFGISLSLHRDCLWLTLTLFTAFFFMTVLCRKRFPLLVVLPTPDSSVSSVGNINDAFVEIDCTYQESYWINDMPPCYDIVTGHLPEPPPYISIHELPPSYYAEDTLPPLFFTSQSKNFTDVSGKPISEGNLTPSNEMGNL